MRIGMVTGEYPPMEGGVGAYSRILARQFIQMGHTVSVFSDQRSSSNPLDAIQVFPEVKSWGPLALYRLRKWSRQQRLDLISLQFQTAAFGMSPWIHFLPEICPLPIVTTFHDLRVPYLFPKAGSLRSWIVMRLARHSHGVIVTNHEDAVSLKSLPRHTLIPIGSNLLSDVPPQFDRPAFRAQIGADEKTLLIGYFGFINHSKGVDILLESLSMLLQEGMAARLIMIGGQIGASDSSNNATMKALQQQIERDGLADKLFWTGFVSDEEAAAYFQAVDVVALPFRDGASYRRGTLMAALHHHRPIVTTRPSVAVPDFVDEENLCLVARENSRELAAALRCLYEHPEKQARLQSGARELAKNFQWEQIAEKHMHFFEQILQERA